jgi:hypothetical protein
VKDTVLNYLYPSQKGKSSAKTLQNRQMARAEPFQNPIICGRFSSELYFLQRMLNLKPGRAEFGIWSFVRLLRSFNSLEFLGRRMAKPIGHDDRKLCQIFSDGDLIKFGEKYWFYLRSSD